MKLGGRKIDGPSVEIFVIPRESGDLVFKLQAVLNWEEFTKLCPEPKPPKIMTRGEGTKSDFNDPEYRKKLNEWATSKTHWMVLQSLTATLDLEWETVDLQKSETWKNYLQELRVAGISDPEVGRIIATAQSVNGLDSTKYEEAKKRFLATQEVAAQ